METVGWKPLSVSDNAVDRSPATLIGNREPNENKGSVRSPGKRIAMETHSKQSDPRISVDPNVHFGKPCVAGTRIPVRDVLELLRAGQSFEAITTDYYPDLEDADVQACVQYAIDTIDAEHIHVRTSPQ